MHVIDSPSACVGSVFIVEPAQPVEYAEKILLAAILRRAAYDIAYYRGSRKLLAKRWWESAHRWMFGDESDGEDPNRSAEEMHMDSYMSFVNICYMLNADPDNIRRKTLRMTKKDVRKYDMVDPHGRVY